MDYTVPYDAERDTISIILVDDDESFLDMSVTFLERELEVLDMTTVSTPDIALERLDDRSFDCIISDYEMPDMDGLAFLNSVRQAGIDIPFILFTGKGSEEIASRAITAGVDEYLQKGGPEEYTVLANKVENLVEKHRAERQVQRAFVAIESAEEGIAIIDEEGIYRYMNEAYAGLYNREREEVIGNHWDMLYSDAEAQRFHDEILPELEAEGSWRGVSHGVTKEGDSIPERLVLTRMEAGGHVCIVQELKRDEEVEEYLEWLSEFSHVVSHDLKTPLSILQGNLALAEDTGEPEYLNNAINAAERLDALIDDLANVMSHGALVEATDTVDIDAAFRSVVSFDAATDAVEVNGSKSIIADESAFRRLAENLVKNSMEHAGPDVSMRVGRLPDGFYYEDSGPGIPEDVREEVFKPGFSSKGGGTGFGLVSIRQIARAHGWDVTITESEEGGARFEFRGVTAA